VQARVISVYMLVFQAGLSVGSLVWGELADHLSLRTSLLAAAGWMLASTLLALPFPMRSAEGLNLEPADDRPHTTGEDAIDPDHGPVLVMIDYRIEPTDWPAFQIAAEELKRLRLRDGALRAGVFADVADPTRITEFFYVATWGEHQRQHHRFTREDQVVEGRVRQFHQGPDAPRITHFLSFPNTSNVEVATPISTLESQR
jgi:hypothetical protein